MTKKTKIIFVVGICAFLPFVAFFGYVFYALSAMDAAGDIALRNFLSHDLNKKIYDLNPRWSTEIQDVQIAQMFKSGTDKAEFKTVLSASGYDCKQEFVCHAEAGYTFVCRKSVMISGSFDAVGILIDARVRYHSSCL